MCVEGEGAREREGSEKGVQSSGERRVEEIV